MKRTIEIYAGDQSFVQQLIDDLPGKHSVSTLELLIDQSVQRCDANKPINERANAIIFQALTIKFYQALKKAIFQKVIVKSIDISSQKELLQNLPEEVEEIELSPYCIVPLLNRNQCTSLNYLDLLLQSHPKIKSLKINDCKSSDLPGLNLDEKEIPELVKILNKSSLERLHIPAKQCNEPTKQKIASLSMPSKQEVIIEALNVSLVNSLVEIIIDYADKCKTEVIFYSPHQSVAHHSEGYTYLNEATKILGISAASSAAAAAEDY